MGCAVRWFNYAKWLEVVLMSNNKMPLETNSSAEHVEKHLQELEKADYELL